MYILAIFLCSLFIWLLYETKWLSIRLPSGRLPRRKPNTMARSAVLQPQRNQVMGAITSLVDITATAGMRAAIVYLLAIVVAEVITVVIQPVWGIACHIILLVAVIVHSALTSDHRLRQLVLSLALIPLVRIMSLSMPLTNVPLIWSFPIIYAPLLGAGLMVIRILGYSMGDVGLRLNFRSLRFQLTVALTGFLFGVMEYLILAAAPMMAREFTLQEVWLPAFIFLVCTGFVEEFIFRGVLQRTAVEAFGGWRGIVYISLLFAILHLIHYTANPPISYYDIPFVFIVAMFFGWVVKKTGSLFGVTLAHAITNILLYLIFPFLF